jgi:hypothetical protein
MERPHLRSKANDTLCDYKRCNSDSRDNSAYSAICRKHGHFTSTGSYFATTLRRTVDGSMASTSFGQHANTSAANTPLDTPRLAACRQQISFVFHWLPSQLHAALLRSRVLLPDLGLLRLQRRMDILQDAPVRDRHLLQVPPTDCWEKSDTAPDQPTRLAQATSHTDLRLLNPSSRSPALRFPG